MEDYLSNVCSTENLCHKSSSSIEYFSSFAILKLKIYLSEDGKSKLGSIIAHVQNGLEVVKQSSTKHNYEQVKKELEAIY